MSNQVIPAATARLAGQTGNVTFSVQTGWGSRPAAIRLTAALPALVGVTSGVTDLTIEQGAFSLVLTDVRIASISEASPGGRGIVNIALEDRRWKWAFGYVDGDYNVRKADGQLEREKTPRELAALLAEAMGEPGLDASRLPNDARPRKAWRAANARDELDRLCAELGCVIVFDAGSDSAALWPVGEGADIPSAWQPVEQRSSVAVLPPWPDELRAIGGPALFQSAFRLGDPQGYDEDGSLKPLDQLSYKPEDGWGQLEPYDFTFLEGTYTVGGETRYHRDLAGQSVWRIYKIVELERGGWSPQALVGTDQEPQGIEDIGPFTGSLLEQDAATGQRRPAIVRGVYYDAREAFKNTTAGQIYRGNFSIDSQRGLVIFSEPVYKFAGANGEGPPLEPAELVLVAAYQVSGEGVPVRYERWRALGTQYDVGPRVEQFPGIVREVIEDPAHGEQSSDNLADCDAEMDHYLDAIEAEYQSRTGAELTLTGLQQLTPDGVLRSITWTGGVNQHATTSASYNSEPNPYVPDYRDTPAARARNVAAAERRQAAALEVYG